MGNDKSRVNEPEKKEYKTLREIVGQLEWCNYECGSGTLNTNIAFLKLKELAEQENIRKGKKVLMLMITEAEKRLDEATKQENWHAATVEEAYLKGLKDVFDILDK